MATVETVAAELRTTGRIRLRTLITIRWIAVFGQVIALIVVSYGMGYQVPMLPAAIVVAVSALLNIAAMIQSRTLVRLGDRDATLYLGYDLVQLTVMLFLTGGLENPFSLGPALKFAVFFVAILFVAKLAQLYFGNRGLFAAAALSGLADVDAITLSIVEQTKAGSLADRIGSIAITIAVVSNSIVKSGIALYAGAFCAVVLLWMIPTRRSLDTLLESRP